MKIFENVASLVLATLKEDQLVETKGYYTKGDGGQEMATTALTFRYLF